MKPPITYKQVKYQDEQEVSTRPHTDHAEKARKYYLCALIIAVAITILFTLLASQILLFPFCLNTSKEKIETVLLSQETRCNEQCQVVLVESIPEGLVYEANATTNPSTFQTWMNLIAVAKTSVDIASFYWTLTNNDTHTEHPSANQGEQVLQELTKLKQRGVSLRVAVNPTNSPTKDKDINVLRASGADVRVVDMPRLTDGILHTKFWVVDNKHFYIGSANMDWRSLTQVKELGSAVYNCSCLAQDLQKIFEVYWALGLPNATIPSQWPANYSTTYNKETPMEVALNDTTAKVYLSSSPPPLSPTGRTDDIKSILSIINDAKKFVYISVMDYTPTEEFVYPKRYWPMIDSHLREVVYERRVAVRLLISCWKNSKPYMFPFLTSLAALHSNKSHFDIQVKIFVVPSTPDQKRIPFARVNHNKYMLTDRVAYIGTSNWSGDYFLRTAGSALVVNQTNSVNATNTVQERLHAVFERDWNSNYSHVLHGLGSSWSEKCIF
ncbi:5'-3' exonuclease PLD3 [Pelobates fuscus]|uniref:5'-3' exonuclease PLD3 n=1 Tax=Pelobates fuscus TaxID=191477 RepID=UPI002FE4341E